jgi:hypothetical protein
MNLRIGKARPTVVYRLIKCRLLKLVSGIADIFAMQIKFRKHWLQKSYKCTTDLRTFCVWLAVSRSDLSEIPDVGILLFLHETARLCASALCEFN